ncbi:MAG: helix-turn-helix domain-containing protein [Nitrososphaeria archaeon]|nr:helix-turn-helix domain-containing protein [Nitrososphaeria archaeon]NIN51629.1 helix-turn-helix domain-containing protein [Nitrososphaeria archaeon]NIQ32114.1 helix-turn-helix domain-containing protein [Nitrososphaeria archaeon]
MAKEEFVPLTKSAYKLLAILKDRAMGEYVYRVDIKQSELANTLNISRQALSVKLRPLIERGYIRTGRGFIEITGRGLSALGYYSKPVYILVKVEPSSRDEVYNMMRDKKLGKMNRVAGDIDLILEVGGTQATEVLDFVSSLKGVISTKTYFTLELT